MIKLKMTTKSSIEFPISGNTDSCDGGEDLYNGAVEAATTLLGAISVFAVGFVHLDWRRWGDAALVGVATVGGAVLIAMGRTNQIGLAYGGEENHSLSCFSVE